MKATEINILLVDDQQLTLQGLRQLIEAKSGLTIVGEAFSSQSAMEQITTSAPQLVLMNIDPAKDEKSVENTRCILAKFPSVKVIALSSETKLRFVLEALHAGISGYVVKKHGVEELFRAIHTVMAYDLYLSPEVSAEVTKCFMKSYLGLIRPQAGVVLSDRERSLLQMIAGGKRNKEMAEEMAIGIKSVETYRFRLMKKLRCNSVAELVRYAISEGIVQA